MRGGAGRKLAPVLQPGAQIAVAWRARLEEHLGAFSVEPVRSRAAQLMAGRETLAALNAVTALLSFALPEREQHASLYKRTMALLDMIGEGPVWHLAYLRWELALLEDLGFGLDLGRCAVTGSSHNLVYVSPKTGRAVSSNGAGEWADRMLPLSPALVGESKGSILDVLQGLETTGSFLRHRLALAGGGGPGGGGSKGSIVDGLQGLETTGVFLRHRLALSVGDKPLPEARQRFLDILSRGSRIADGAQ